MNEIENQARELILAQGWRIKSGPYLNSSLQRHGIYVVSMKSVLSKEALASRGMRWDPKSPPNQQRTVRFMCDVTLEGQVEAVTHITSSQRKRLGRLLKTRRRSPKKQKAG